MEAAETPIGNPRLEIVAQELAKGKSPVEASKEAGYPPGSSFDSNARKRAQDARVKARIQYLTRITGVIAACEVADIQRSLLEIVNVPLKPELVTPGDRIRAAAELNKMNGFYAPEKHDTRAAVATMDFSGDVSDEETAAALTALLTKIKTKSEAA
jgi:hypothetical protein